MLKQSRLQTASPLRRRWDGPSTGSRRCNSRRGRVRATARGGCCANWPGALLPRCCTNPLGIPLRPPGYPPRRLDQRIKSLSLPGYPVLGTENRQCRGLRRPKAGTPRPQKMHARIDCRGQDPGHDRRTTMNNRRADRRVNRNGAVIAGNVRPIKLPPRPKAEQRRPPGPKPGRIR